MSVDPADGCTFWYTQEYYADTRGELRLQDPHRRLQDAGLRLIDRSLFLKNPSPPSRREGGLGSASSRSDGANAAAKEAAAAARLEPATA